MFFRGSPYHWFSSTSSSQSSQQSFSIQYHFWVCSFQFLLFSLLYAQFVVTIIVLNGPLSSLLSSECFSKSLLLLYIFLCFLWKTTQENQAGDLVSFWFLVFWSPRIKRNFRENRSRDEALSHCVLYHSFHCWILRSHHWNLPEMAISDTSSKRTNPEKGTFFEKKRR